MVFCPAVVDVLEEGRIVDLHLGEQTRVGTAAPAVLPLAPGPREGALGTLGSDEVTEAMTIQGLQAVTGMSPTYLFFVHTQKRFHRCVCAGKRAERQVSSWGSHAPREGVSCPQRQLQPELPRWALGGRNK